MAAFSHLGTLDHTLALHLGEHFKQQNHKNTENMLLSVLQKDTGLQCESWHENAEHSLPYSTSPGNVSVGWLNVFSILHACKSTMRTDSGIMSEF